MLAIHFEFEKCPRFFTVRCLILRDQLVPVRVPGPGQSRYELDLSISVESLGVAWSNVKCKEVPANHQIIEYAFRRVGWDFHRFHVYAAV